MAILDWLRGLFGGSAASLENEAAARSDFGVVDRGEAEIRQAEQYPSFAGNEAADVAEEDLSEFQPPRDPAP